MAEYLKIKESTNRKAGIKSVAAAALSLGKPTTPVTASNSATSQKATVGMTLSGFSKSLVLN